MQVTETLSDGLKRAFAVVVPAADIEGKCRAKLADISRNIKLPGFRPGKVPVNLVRQRYGRAVLAEVMQDSLDKAAGQVIEDRGLRPAGQPKIELTGAVPNIDSGKASDLAFSVELEVLPDIVAPDLSSLQLTRLRAVASSEHVDQTLARFAMKQRELVPVEEDRGAASGDILIVDYAGSIDGVPFDGGTGTDIRVELGSSGFITGFAEQLEGMRPGEQRRIEVTFPEDYHTEALRGKAAVFEVTAKALQRPVEQALDDAFAAKLGLESLQKLRDTVTGQIQAEYDQLSRLRLKRELLDQLSAKADFPAPQNLVDFEFSAIWQRVEADLKQGRMDDEDRGKDVDTLRTEYRAIADRRVRLGLLLSEIGRSAGVQVSQAELNLAMRREAARYPGQEMQVIEFFRKTPAASEQLRGPIFEDKVVDYILELARVEDRVVSPEELDEPIAGDLRGTVPGDDSAMLRAPVDVAAALEAENAALPASAEAAEDQAAGADAPVAGEPDTVQPAAVAAEIAPVEVHAGEPHAAAADEGADHASVAEEGRHREEARHEDGQAA